jgi:hypothetical protein
MRIPSRVKHYFLSEFQFLSRFFFKNSIGVFRNLKINSIDSDVVIDADIKKHGFKRTTISKGIVSEALVEEIKARFHESDDIKEILHDHGFLVQKRLKKPVSSLKFIGDSLDKFYDVFYEMLKKPVRLRFVSVMEFQPFSNEIANQYDLFANKYHVDWTEPGRYRVFVPLYTEGEKDSHDVMALVSASKWKDVLISGYKSRSDQGNVLDIDRMALKLRTDSDALVLFDASRFLHKQVHSETNKYVMLLLIVEVSSETLRTEWANDVGTLARER